MVSRGANDLFLAGDTHQRIYDNYVSLGSLGIEIRGRSSRLTLTYRSTHEILTAGSIGPDGPRLHDGVHVGTLQRFKGPGIPADDPLTC
ncbi:MAG: hypothetical protein ABSA53_11220 [Streptosporangiaceae bacterium]|jgi:hypothetical protein